VASKPATSASLPQNDLGTSPLSRPNPQPAATESVQQEQPVAKEPTVASSGSDYRYQAPFVPNNSENAMGYGFEQNNNGYMGIGFRPFPREVADILAAELKPHEIEIKPDGLLYLPEIRYRRILNRAFGPGGWGLLPQGEPSVEAKTVSREYALFCHGRLVSIARGEQEFFNDAGITTALEGCKSNALMRCCKDLGIASELWDPDFIREFKDGYCESKFHAPKKRFVWKLKRRPWEYPYNQ
jgi:hypothetical protein